MMPHTLTPNGPSAFVPPFRATTSRFRPALAMPRWLLLAVACLAIVSSALGDGNWIQPDLQTKVTRIEAGFRVSVRGDAGGYDNYCHFESIGGSSRLASANFSSGSRVWTDFTPSDPRLYKDIRSQLGGIYFVSTYGNKWYPVGAWIILTFESGRYLRVDGPVWEKWYDEGDSLDLHATADLLPFPQNTAPTVDVWADPGRIQWDASTTIHVKVSDSDFASSFDVWTWVEEGTGIVDNGGIGFISNGGGKDWSFKVTPKSRQFGWVHFKIRCLDKFSIDSTKNIDVYKDLWFEIFRPIVPPSIPEVGAVPAVRAGGNTVETFKVRVEDDYTPASNLRIVATSLSPGMTATAVGGVVNNWASIEVKTDAPLPNARVQVQVTDGDGQSATKIVPVPTLPDKAPNPFPQVDGVARSLNFDGAKDTATVPSAVWFKGDFTLETWVYPRRLDTAPRLLDFGNGLSSDNVSLYLSKERPGALALLVRNGNASKVLESRTTVPAWEWTHVAAVVQGRFATLYINGEEAGSGDMESPADVVRSQNFLGSAGDGKTGLLDGLLDEVRIWNTSRSASLVKWSMFKSLTGNSDGLVAAWPLNEGTGKYFANKATGTASNLGSKANGTLAAPTWDSGVPYEKAYTPNEDTDVSVLLTGAQDNIWSAVVLPTWGVLTTKSNTEDRGGGPRIIKTRYVPEADFNGPDRAILKVSATSDVTLNGSFGSKTIRLSVPQALTFNVQPINDAPVFDSNSLSFTGGNHLKVEGTDAGFGFSALDPFSIEAWVMPRVVNREQELIGKWTRGVEGGFRLFLTSSGTVAFGRGHKDQAGKDLTDPARLLTSPLPLKAGKWTHVAVTYDGSQLLMYLDGALAAQTLDSDNAVRGGALLRIGATASGVGFDGMMNEVRIWSVTRSVAELAGSMSATLTGGEAGLLVYYRMAEGSGVRALDSAKTSVRKPNLLDAHFVGSLAWGTTLGSISLPALEVRVSEDSPGVVVALPVLDVDRDFLDLTIARQPLHGEVKLDPSDSSRYIYIPATNYSGADYFEYQASDRSAPAKVGRVNLNVVEVNDPPTITPIDSILIEEGGAPVAASFTVSDPDDDVTSLNLRAVSLDQLLLPDANLSILGTGSQRQLKVISQPGVFGTARVRVTVSDRETFSSQEVLVSFSPSLAYTVLDLGDVGTAGESIAMQLDQSGRVAGYQPDGPGFVQTGFVYDNFLYGGRFAFLPQVNSRVNGLATASDGTTWETGFYKSAGVFTAFRRSGQELSSFPVPAGAGEVAGTAINGNGTMVGFFTVAGQDKPFRLLRSEKTLTTALILPGFTSADGNGRPVSVNRSDVLAGNSVVGGKQKAWIHDGRTRTFLEPPSGYESSWAGSLNDDGKVAGYLVRSQNKDVVPAIWSAAGGWVLLPRPASVTKAIATSLNRYGQSVGTGTNGNVTVALLNSGASSYNLNDLLPEASGWKLQSAVGINDNGQITGVGVPPNRPGERHAYLAVPASVIGKRVQRPDGSVGRFPVIEVIEGSPGDDSLNSFYWSEVEKSLYALRPVKARVKWQVTTDPRDTNNITIPALVVNTWPKDPEIHVFGAPVTVQPVEENRQFHFAEMHYSTMPTATVDVNTKVFTAPTNGYSVFRYLRTYGALPDPNTQSNVFTVARSVYVYNPKYLSNADCWIGKPITDAYHQDSGKLNGYLYFEKTPVDSIGEDAAYNRASRLGPIIPVNAVNKKAPVKDDDLIVVWYRRNSFGVAWASRPVKYNPLWPTDTGTIIIASTQGSNLQGNDPVTDSTYPGARIYNQPDYTLPGFNPNEEHAMLLPSNLAAPDPLVFDVLPPMGSGLVGASVFALRSDLNEIKNYSQPYVLLKFADPSVSEWRFKLYKVVPELHPYHFVYAATAGTEIQPPYPLSLLNISESNKVVVGAEWTLKDYRGKIYATAAGADGALRTNIVIRYNYPLQPGFFYDFDTTPGTDLAVGKSIGWIDRRSGRTAEPVDVQYIVKWPSDRPVLDVGETLMRAKHGLPGVADMARVKTVFDSVNPDMATSWKIGPGALTVPPTNAARIYDPLSERTYAFGRSFKMPDVIRLQDGPLGRKYFTDLPYHLRVRLSYDPLNKWLYFKGVLDESGIGEPLLLPNVMSSSERDRVKDIDKASESDFDKGIDALYKLTRNPNELDLDSNKTADDALLVGLQYAVKSTSFSNGLPVVNYDNTRIELEAFPAGLKALSAAAINRTSAEPKPGSALVLSGGDDGVTVTNIVPALVDAFTFEAYVKRTGLTNEDIVVSHGDNDRALKAGFTSDGYFFMQFEKQRLVTSRQYLQDVNAWHHWAGTYQRENGTARLFRDGALVAEMTDLAIAVNLNGTFRIGSGTTPASGFHGQLDEVRYWQGVARDQSQIQAYRKVRLSSAQPNLVGYWLMDEKTGNIAIDSGGYRHHGIRTGSATTADATDADWGVPPRFISLVENNDPVLGALPVSVKVIEIGPGPFRGDLKALYPDNVFDERLTLRMSSDFGGEPNDFNFEWYYKPDAPGLDKTVLPTLDENGNVSDLRGWIAYTPGLGAGKNYITLGEGGESGLLTISDNWFIARYSGYKIGKEKPWSAWVGDPSSKSVPQPMLAEGWIKRVVRGLNPFDERVSDFVNNRASTKVSIVQQAGGRYEGDIAFNPSGDNLNRIGLIEAYETVERRGKSLSTDGSPAVNYQPANDALLFIGSRIADLYMLLGNEAMADAADPTIGFTTSSGEYGNTAASIFAFQNQVDSLLEEELGLLRGRDDSSAGVQGAPIYNRLFWNFTLGDGEVAYQQVYNISDQNADGKVDEQDARIMYPQGHGDAWGHYLTAIKSYYALLRNPNFTWLPRSESVLLGGVPVKVDYLDERKFAKIAAAKAKCGGEIVDLTYRLNYVDDPNGQWQGYQDTDRSRAWGVDDWASRAAVGTYLDWLMANAVLPSSDPNPGHTGIDKIDRTTVGELNELNAQLSAIQAQIDKADQGLNPVGLAKGVVPFDIDPSFLEIGSGVQGQTHFEQIFDRAISAMQNAVAVFNEVNANSHALRSSQDTVEAFTREVEEQERDFKNRLIEVYGYPYAGDIGAGKTYVSGYDGPDLLHYMYIPTKEISADSAPPSSAFTAFFQPLKTGFGTNGLTFPGDNLYSSNGVALPSELTQGLNVTYPISASDYAYVAPQAWGLRRAPGELQSALSDLVQEEARLKQALYNYNNLILSISDKLKKFGEKSELTRELEIREKAAGKEHGLNASILAMNILSKVMNRAADRAQRIGENLAEALPTVVGTANDTTSAGRSQVKSAGHMAGIGLAYAGDVADAVAAGLDFAKEETAMQADLDVLEANAQGERQTELKEVLELFREEAPLRLELYNQREVVNQTSGRYQAMLAQGQRILEERVAFRKKTAGEATKLRYSDMAFRIFRNDAIQKYRAQFDLAARYTFLAATAYDYESNLIGNDGKAGRRFLTDIVRQRSLGQMNDAQPVAGRFGLADALARLQQNFSVMKTQMGFNNPQHEENSFSLRSELFRIQPHSDDNPDPEADQLWRDKLNQSRVADLWQVPQFRRYCRPMAPESAGPQPGLVIKFPTTVTFGLNYFGWPLGGGDSAYDPSQFVTKIRSAGVWFSGYNGNGLSFTPRVYLIPTGADVLRSPNGDNFDVRLWRVVDQKLPLPFPISQADMKNPAYIPAIDNLGGEMAEIRKYSSFRAYHDAGADTDQMSTDSRLIGRSVWNTEWVLIIPGGTLLNNPDTGLDTFIESINDIRFSFLTYAYSGN